MNDAEPLKFEVAAHIVEDLGLNLYTDLPRVLVEFVANAYDADSSKVSINVDFEQIKEAREKIKENWVNRKKENPSVDFNLAVQTLPEELCITILVTFRG